MTFDYANKNAIVYCCDNKYIDYLIVSIHSLISNFNFDGCKKLNIFVLESDITLENKSKVESLSGENIHITFVSVNHFLQNFLPISNLKVSQHWSIALYYRLLIPVIFKEYSNILYLDTDTIVNSDISDLFDIDFATNKIAVVTDTVAPIFPFYPDRYEQIIKNGLKVPDKYFNSGVILFNIKNINIEEYLSALREVLEKPLEFYDQDALNIIFQNKALYLDMKYNLQICFLGWKSEMEKLDVNPQFKNQLLSASKNPKIIHFIGPWKPWSFLDVYGSHFFWKYARSSIVYENLIFSNFKENTIPKEDIYALSNLNKITIKYKFYSFLSKILLNKNKHLLSRKLKYKKMLSIISKYKI